MPFSPAVENFKKINSDIENAQVQIKVEVSKLNALERQLQSLTPKIDVSKATVARREENCQFLVSMRGYCESKMSDIERKEFCC